MLQKQQKKRLLKQTEHLKKSSFTSIAAIIAIDALKTEEQMRLKIGKKLRIASLNSKFTCSYKKRALKNLFEINVFEI